MTNAKAIARDVEVLTGFVGIYCRAKHAQAGGELCLDCRSLLEYAAERRRKCPHDPKPACKDCRTHCYRPERRAKIREVMRFSGPRSLGRGGLKRLLGLLFGRRGARVHQDTN